ncbi:hypothetical protein LOTGIDRAFT_155203 [Lottia gigantea]|uniref:Polysaccharide pyruvyl transferase domain-containing protein n=1 Tax=Lottia gigantea TaxID=225164 RepID=V3ZT11_LOTGI|nr:hypothetical protein LOTGIDRAFT_155203 [Lottia gigantea]ESO85710.1 hypothetical protein LOTGIDRAFT_155203 [Lottia gigantea]
MSLMFASSTFAIKLMEPITSACVQRLLLATPLHPSIFVSLPLIVGGACMFTGNPLTDTSLSKGTLLAFLSNVILAVRNATIKKDQHNSSRLNLRPSSTIAMVIICHLVFTTVLYLIESHFGAENILTRAVFFTVLSSVFHVVYSYISTNMVLRYMSVLSHSVCNIMKRVLVVILLYIVGSRHASFSNFLGLMVSTVGLFIYVGFKVSLKNSNDRDATPKEQGKRDRMSIKIAAFLISLVCLSIIGMYSDTNVKLRHRFDNVAKMPLEDFALRSFGRKSLDMMDTSDLEPYVDDGHFENGPRLKRFLRKKLIQTPYDTDILSPHLKTSTEVIREAQRVHFNLFKDLLRGFRYAMLLDVAALENKGDPAISSGEIYLLRRLGIDLIYYCSFRLCTDKNLQYAQNMSSIYSNKELVILVHGGGNIVGYPVSDILRFKILDLFKGFKIVVMPQSIFLIRQNTHFEHCKKLYCCNKNLTFVLRDRQSLAMAQTFFNNGTNLIMTPDMAFQIGRVKRYMSPMYDILWLKRKDIETPNYKIPRIPEEVSVTIQDWLHFLTPKGNNSLENAFLIATNGMMFLQRGRVVITDRLHGHILCTLLDIPHVLIDNKYKKLSSYHRTWTRGVENTLITTNATEAVSLALQLLKKYTNVIPPVAPFMNVVENPV